MPKVTVNAYLLANMIDVEAIDNKRIWACESQILLGIHRDYCVILKMQHIDDYRDENCDDPVVHDSARGVIEVKE